jgi:hypothetical protein
MVVSKTTESTSAATHFPGFDAKPPELEIVTGKISHR